MGTKGKGGKNLSKDGDANAANTSGSPAGQVQNRFTPKPGGGSSSAKGKKKKAKATKRNDRPKLHPVSPIGGDVVDDAIDLALPGPIPVVLKRLYSSAFNEERTPFGRGGWTHELHQWVGRDDEDLVLRGEDGRNLALPDVAANATGFHRGSRLVIARGEGDRYDIENLDTLLTRVFAPLVAGGRAMLREIRDRWGNRVELVYTGESLVRVKAMGGRELRFAHDVKGRILRVEAWAAGAVQQAAAYAYTAAGELARATNALGHFDAYAYDGLQRLSKLTLKNGVSFYYEYDDELDRCVKAWGDNDLHPGEFIYDLEARTTVFDSYEARRITWNDKGALVREETPDGDYATEYVYDDDLLVLAEKNAADETTSYEYDARGNLITLTDPAGNVTRWEVANDFPARRTRPDGLVTSYVYDRRGALVDIVYPTGLRFQLTYDGAGQLATIFGAEGPVASFEYDGAHNLVRETDARGAATAFTYDPLGRLLTRTDPLGRVTRIEYDLLGRPVVIHRPDGTKIQLAYDALGNVVRHADAMGRVTKMEYAATGVLTKQTMPDGQEWRFTYDGIERLRDVINPKSEVYGFEYDRAGRVRQETTFDHRTLRYSYSRANHLARIDYPDETWRAFQYDPLGNVVLETSPHGPQKYMRDKLGRLLEATVIEHDGKTVVKLERDAFGRVVVESQNGQTLRFEYDVHGRRTSRALPGGETTRYAYDVAGAMVGIDHDGHQVAVQRDVLGREVRRHIRRGAVDIFSAYDGMDRLVDQWTSAPTSTGAQAQTVMTQRKWSYDPTGRVAGIQDARWGHTHYRYDEIGHLAEASRGKHREVFEYDGAGSLVGIFDDGSSRHGWSLLPGNLLLQASDTELEYDQNHRRKKSIHRDTGAVTEFFWDCRDRLREVWLPGGEKVLYTYDAFGRRVRKDIVPKEPAAEEIKAEPERVRVVHFVWDGNVLASELDTERGKRVFVHEPGTFVPMLQQEQGEVFTYVNDHLGTPKELIDQGGRVAWAAAHTAWGSVVETWRDRGRTVQSPFRLLGQYFDEETGLCCTRFRYFDSQSARWLSPDPLGLAGGSNLFAFDGPPTVDVDPFGLCKLGYAKLWHDKRADAIFGPGKGKSVGGRHYDKAYANRDVEFKSDNFARGPRSEESLARMGTQVDKDIANLQSGQANPAWHFENDPRVAPEMRPVLDSLKEGNVPVYFGTQPLGTRI